MSDGLGGLVGDFQTAETLFNPAGVAVQIAKPDPSRWALIFSSATAGANVWVSTLSSVTTSRGTLLSGNAPNLAINFRDLGAVINGAWFGFAAAPNGINVLEVFYRPVGQPIVTEDDLQELADRLERGDLSRAERLVQ